MDGGIRMSEENQAFTAQLKKFCEHGLFKEVYRSEKAIVCNVLDQFYVAFDRNIVQDRRDNFPGYIMLKSSGLLEVLRNDDFVSQYFGYLTPQQHAILLMRLDDDHFTALLQLKEAFALNPPPCRLDLDFEQKVMKDGKAVIKGLRWHKYFLPMLRGKENLAIELLPIVKPRQ